MPEFRITDRNVTSGKDYHTMTWKQRAIDLNEIKGPLGNLVTGVRLVSFGAHLNLEVRMTEFDFETGQLRDPETTSIWYSSYHTIEQVSDLKIEVNNESVLFFDNRKFSLPRLFRRI